MRILMLVANSVYRDPRVVKEARTLALAGHTVMVAGLEEDNDYPEVPRDQPFEVKLYRPRTAGLNWVRSVVGRMGGVQQPEILQVGELGHGILRSMHAAQLFLSVHWSFAPAFRDLLEWGPQAVHSHDLNTLRTAVLLGKLARIPVVYDAHEIWSEMGNYHPIYKRWLTGVERHLLQHGVSRVITVSESIADWMKERYHIEKPEVIVNSPDWPEVGEPGVGCRARQGVVFLYQGALTQGRGLDLLVRAFKYVQSNAVLIVRGTGPLRDRLRWLISTYAIEKAKLAEPVPPADVIRLAAEEADIGVVALSTSSLNNYLALPNKLFEYMAAGLAILSPDIPEIRKLQSRCCIGWLYSESSAEGLAHKIDQIVGSGSLRQLKHNSRRLYLEEFRWSEVAKKLVRIYEDL